MNKFAAFVGPTASGKTSLSVKMAKLYNAEIISCDSMQLYRGMNIGTAKPTQAEQDGVIHHMIDVLDVNESFSVSDYVDRVNLICEIIEQRQKVAFFCGGTGLYIDSFISGINFGDFEIDINVREELCKDLQNYGSGYLFEKLKVHDPQSAAKICENNTKRVMRALEVYYSTGITLSEWNERSKVDAKKKDACIIGLDFSDRTLLYDRIDKRVDIMLQQGIVEETKSLIDLGIRNSPTAGQAIGYKEFYPYFDGESTLEECVEILKRNSRRYAKRQLTWFRRNPDIHWIMRDDLAEEQILQQAVEIYENYLRR